MYQKKILFISYDGMTDPLGQSQVIPYLKGLTSFGYSFTILSCDKPTLYKTNKGYVEQMIAAFPITWVSIPYHKNPPVLSALYDYYALKQKAKNLQLLHHFDMVHSRPGLPSLVAIYLQQKFGIKFLNDIRGFWADERVDGGIWDLRNPVLKLAYHFFKRHEQDCLLKANYHICLTHKACNEIHARKNIPHQPLPIRVIPCSVDMDLFNPEKNDPLLKEKFKSELGIQESDFIISYLGSLGGWYLTAEMMRFCKKVSDNIPNAKFLFICPHPFETVAAAASLQGIPKEKLLVQHGKRHEVPVLLSLSTYSLFFIKPCHSKLASSPTKHGEIMAMGIPVITNSGVGDVAEIVTKYKAGYVLDNFSDASFSKAIEKLLAENTFDKDRIRNGAKEFYDLKYAVGSYKKVYDIVLNDDDKKATKCTIPANLQYHSTTQR